MFYGFLFFVVVSVAFVSVLSSPFVGGGRAEAWIWVSVCCPRLRRGTRHSLSFRSRALANSLRPCLSPSGSPAPSLAPSSAPSLLGLPPPLFPSAAPSLLRFSLLHPFPPSSGPSLPPLQSLLAPSSPPLPRPAHTPSSIRAVVVVECIVGIINFLKKC